MTQSLDDADLPFAGSLARIVRLDDEAGIVHAEFQNGNVVQLTWGSGDVHIGTIVVVGERTWRPAPDELWLEPRGIGVVRKRLEGRLLIEGPGGLVLTEGHGPVFAETNNTVRYSIREGAVELVDEGPLRIRLRDDDIEDLSKFEFSASGRPLSYRDFGGYPQVVERARHIIETQFLHKDMLDAIGARPVRGVLLSGPPGTGKTHLARVIASEADAAFFVVSGPSIVSKYVGDTEQLLRHIFDEAKSRERAIVFFDEIDSIAGERREGSHEASDRLVAQLLTEMDGFDTATGNVVVLAATNRPDSIDAALRRPGRFDWEIEFGLPTVEDRLAILEVDARRLTTRGTLPLEEIAEGSPGWSGAELASIWTEASLLAASQGRSELDGEDILEAFDLVKDGQKGKEE